MRLGFALARKVPNNFTFTNWEPAVGISVNWHDWSSDALTTFAKRMRSLFMSPSRDRRYVRYYQRQFDDANAELAKRKLPTVEI